MNLNDLEGHLNALKEMFIQKQKMMDELEKVTDAPPAGIWKKKLRSALFWARFKHWKHNFFMLLFFFHSAAPAAAEPAVGKY